MGHDIDSRIIVYGGRRGNGKSFLCCKRALDYIAAGGCVYSTCKIQVEPWESPTYGHMRGARWWLRERRKWELQDGQVNHIVLDDMARLHEHIPAGTSERPVFVWIDEALDFLHTLHRGQNAGRLWDFLTFLRYSRKYHISLCFSTQSAEKLNPDVRFLVDEIRKCRDVSKIRIPPFKVRVPRPWRDNFREVAYDAESGEKLTSIWHPHDWTVGECYDTEEKQSGAGVGARLSGSVTTDFRGKGRIAAGMSGGERVLVYGCLVVALGVAGAARKEASASRAATEAARVAVVRSGEVVAGVLESAKGLAAAAAVAGGAVESGVSEPALEQKRVEREEPFSLVRGGRGVWVGECESGGIARCGGRVGLQVGRRWVCVGDIVEGWEVVAVGPAGMVLRRGREGAVVWSRPVAVPDVAQKVVVPPAFAG